MTRPEESRVLVVAPMGQDAEAMAGMLRAEGLVAEVCAGAGECLDVLKEGAGAVLLTEEALEMPKGEELLEGFRGQPAWSELPLIILTSGGESRSARLLEIAAKVAGAATLLERPMRAGTLLHSVVVALRSRERQYQVRDLLAERERFRALVTATSDVVYRMSADWKEMLHSEGKGVIPATTTASDKWMDRYVPVEDQERVRGAVQEAIRRGSRLELEHQMLRADGTVGWAFSRAIPVLDENGTIVEWFGAANDVTERKRAEGALRESERQFQTLADSISNLAWWANGDGYLTWYNRRWYEYTGTTPEQMEGWGWQSVHDPEMLPCVLERWKGAIGTGDPFEMEFPLRGADGRFRWFLTRVMPVKDGAGKVVRWFGTNTDVSEIREAREVLRRSKADLEGLVAERTAELRELVGELEHFSYSITHDMRAPLRAMMGFSEVAKELCAESGSREQKMFLERIQTAARRMDLLITDALNYSRTVRSELPLAPVDLGRLLRGMVHTYPELQGAQEGIWIEPELPLVMGNEAALTQCFSNLLGNAVKFTKPGESPKVRVWAETLEEDGRWVRIWVEDRGIGIGPRMLPRVFDMFARGASEQAGTGIGLALVRKVVQRMGGRVGVESEEGRGSRFWVQFRSGM